MTVLLFTEIESKYDKKMKSLREELELRRKTEIHEIEEVCLLRDFWHKMYSFAKHPSTSHANY